MRHDLQLIGGAGVTVLLRWDTGRVRWRYRCRRCGRKFTALLLWGEPFDIRELDDCPGAEKAPTGSVGA